MRIKTIEVLGESPSAADGSVVLLQKFSCRRRRFRAVAMIGCGVFLSLPLCAIVVAQGHINLHLVGYGYRWRQGLLLT